jgi:hypothetical protein
MPARRHTPALALLCAAALALPASTHASWPHNGLAVCAAPGDQRGPALAPDGAGGAIVVWTDTRAGEPDLLASRVTLAGNPDPAWPLNGAAVCTAAGAQDAPVVIADGAGGAIVFWNDQRGADTDLYAQRITAAGVVAVGWPAGGLAICEATGDQFHGGAISDGAGGAIVVWSDPRAGARDVYALRITGTGTVAAGWTAGGTALCTATGVQDYPRAVADGVGGAIVVWSDTRSGGLDLYATRVTADGALAPGWDAGGRPVCVAAGAQVEAAIVPDGAGGAFIAWRDARDFGTQGDDLYAQRLLPNGTIAPGWAADGEPVCVAANSQSGPRLAADGSGGLLVCWIDERNVDVTAFDLYAQRLDADGQIAPGWTADGLALCGADSDQDAPVCAGDGAGGFYAAWVDYRNQYVSDPYALRMTGAGAVGPGWNPDGEPVCAAGGEQYALAAVADGAGGMLVAWEDDRGTSTDLFLHRVTPDGVQEGTVDVSPGPADTRLRASVTPNPMRASLAITIETVAGEPLAVEVLDLSGRRVLRLLDEPDAGGGRRALAWDGADAHGRSAPAGVYVLRATTGAHTVARRVVKLP